MIVYLQLIYPDLTSVVLFRPGDVMARASGKISGEPPSEVFHDLAPDRSGVDAMGGFPIAAGDLNGDGHGDLAINLNSAYGIGTGRREP